MNTVLGLLAIVALCGAWYELREQRVELKYADRRERRLIGLKSYLTQELCRRIDENCELRKWRAEREAEATRYQG